jgi:hypothetical protein
MQAKGHDDLVVGPAQLVQWLSRPSWRRSGTRTARDHCAEGGRGGTATLIEPEAEPVTWAPVTHRACARQPKGGEDSPDQVTRVGGGVMLAQRRSVAEGQLRWVATPVETPTRMRGTWRTQIWGPSAPGTHQRGTTTGGGCGDGMELGGGSWVHNLVVL